MGYTPLQQEGSPQETYRYRKQDRDFWWGVACAPFLFACCLFEVHELLNSGYAVAAVFSGILSIGPVTAVLWTQFSQYGRQIEVGSTGIASASRGRKIASTWEQVKAVKLLTSRWSRKQSIQLETSRGDFIIGPGLDGFDKVLATLRKHVPDRIAESKARWFRRSTCSNCGTAFWSSSCPFCEVPSGDDEAPAIK